MTAAPHVVVVSPGRSGTRNRVTRSAAAWLLAPWYALQFLTILPPVIRRAPSTGDLGRSEVFFPAVGLALGASLACLDLLLTPLVAPLVLDVLLVAALAVLTGALHLDGVVDTFDGLFAGPDAERRLAIMRDPRAGSYGVAALVLLLALKLAALASLPPVMRTPALVLAPCLGRWGIVLATGTFAYARPEGMGRDFKEAITWSHVGVAGFIAFVAAGLVTGLGGVLAWIGASVAVLLAGRWIAGRLGGLSGDTYGAICELTEALVLIAFGLRIWGNFG